MNPAITIFYDGSTKCLRDYLREQSNGFLMKVIGDKLFWLYRGPDGLEEILVSDPISDEGDLSLCDIKQSFEDYLEHNIRSLSYVEIRKGNKKTSLDKLGREVAEKLWKELSLRHINWLVYDVDYDTIKQLEIKEPQSLYSHITQSSFHEKGV